MAQAAKPLGLLDGCVATAPRARTWVGQPRLRLFESYPASETDPTVPRSPARVIGEVILELLPDGEVVDRISVLDLFDPQCIG